MSTNVVPLDEIPDDVSLDMPHVTSVVYEKCNRREGHLLIESGHGDYVFINTGGGVITFGHFAGPSVDLTPEQLRVVGDYCHRMADRIEVTP